MTQGDKRWMFGKPANTTPKRGGLLSFDPRWVGGIEDYDKSTRQSQLLLTYEGMSRPPAPRQSAAEDQSGQNLGLPGDIDPREITVWGVRPDGMSYEGFANSARGDIFVRDIEFFDHYFGNLAPEIAGNNVGPADQNLDYVHVNDIGEADFLVYVSSTGDLWKCKDGEYTLVAKGYSGQGDGLNNPSMQNSADVGPIPVGTYEVTGVNQTLNTHPAKEVIVLKVADGTTTPGRDPATFRIHGGGGPTASEGCIVVPLATRQQIAQNIGISVVVVAQMWPGG